MTNKILKAAIGIGSAAIVGAAFFVFADVTGELPPSSDGNYLQWTISNGTSTQHYTRVDEASCNGTTDYNYTNTVGNRDSYGVSLSSIPNGSVITAIEITPCASRNKGGGGSATMNVFYRFNGADSADAGSYALTGTTPVGLSATTYSGLSLSKDSSSTLEIGAVLSAGTKGARLSRISVKVTYDSVPTVTTNSASSITSSSATLNGSANPKGLSTTGWFRYSSINPGSCDDSFGTRVPVSGGTDLGSGNSPVNYSESVTSLSPATTYHYCAIASNSIGTGFGGIRSFATLPLPPAAPSNLTATTSVASTTNVVLNWTDNSSNEDSFRVEHGTDGVNFSEIGSVPANTTTFTHNNVSSGTHYYRVRARNTGGDSDYSNTASVVVP